MDVIQRNFFRLLISGTFGHPNEAIEPMSPWKWNKLFNISFIHGVTALTHDGMKNYANDFFMQVPVRQKAKWEKLTEETENANLKANKAIEELFGMMNKEQLRPILLRGIGMAALYPAPLHRACGDVDIYFPYMTQANKANKWARDHDASPMPTDKGSLAYTWNGLDIEHYTQAQRLTNIMLNRRLQDIINKEIRCCDSAYIRLGETKIEIMPPTINLLLTIVRIARYILNEGICLKQIVDLGMLMRKVGNEVDFAKLQKWIGRLQLTGMAQLEGSLLVQMLGFSPDEIPFMDSKTTTNISKVLADAFSMTEGHNDDWYFTQGQNIFVRTNNSRAMTWQMKHLIRFFGYYPGEAMTSFLSSFAHSMTHIEE